MSCSLKNGYLAPAGGQNITYIFSNFRAYTFQKSKMSCLCRWFLAKKLKYFTDQNGAKGGPHENEF